LIGQPGTLACLVAAVVMVCVVSIMAGRPARLSLATLPILLSPSIGMSVILTWMGTYLTGFWIPDRGWIDRLGRALGICWVLLAVVLYLSLYLS
jgi:hypothetical protein